MDSSSLKAYQFGKLVLSSGLLHISWSKISEIHASTYTKQNSGLRIKIFEEANYMLVAFVAPPICRNSSSNSVSTLLSGSEVQNPFHFLCSGPLSSFSVHTRAFQLFSKALKDVPQLKSEILQSWKPVIITGAALGGSVASLFTLWLLETFDPVRKRPPLCITFGSPLIGDASLQHILQYSVRNSCFLHVAEAAQTPIPPDAKPFGTFLICFHSQSVFTDDPEAVTELLSGVDADLVDWRDYGEILRRLDQSVFSMVDSRPMTMSDDLINRMEERAAKRKLHLDMVNKLVDVNILIMYIACYRKVSQMENIPYYDRFKAQTLSMFDTDVENHKMQLNSYWKSVVEELEKTPGGEMSNLKKKFIFAGTYYRRMIEPFDIAEYYLSGREEYRTSGRSHHYVMLEKWFEEEFIKSVRFEWRDLSAVLTCDSCFWAEVEEAKIVNYSLKSDKGVMDEILTRKLVWFEEYVWEMIQKRVVSPEIFWAKSSFMRWWKEYKEIKRRFSSSPSGFTEFMDSGMYESYGSPIQGKTPPVADHVDNSSVMKEEGTSYPIILKAGKEMTASAECVVAFSYNGNLDLEESSFIKSILKELHDREVTPLTYNLSGREIADEEMLNRSSVRIMVLSNSFACSSQSLDHLVAIMEHVRTRNHVIIPIYFKVTHADICGLKGRIGAAFLQYQNSVQADRVQKWETAIAEIRGFGGQEWTKGTQVMLAEKVVRNACLRVDLRKCKNLARILAILNNSQPSDAEIVGLWGMAGIGKTSIARDIFDILAPQYDTCYFLQDFYLMCQTKGLRQLRDDFLSKVFGEEELSISSCDIKPSFMRDWFHNKTILVVLDDVIYARDAEDVVGGFGWFSHGHRIILTSRRKQVLVQCKVKEPYEIQQLCETESLRLCKQYLNRESAVISDLMSYSSGIPLALKVLGSSVKQNVNNMVSVKQNVNNMVEHLQRLRITPPTQIRETFRRSFDGLDGNEKNIFLDLACFFRGENIDHVVQLLDACGFFTYLGISELIDESLISLLDGKIEIPIPFQDCGRFIVHQEDEDPCERSRLWDSNDTADVLTNNSGTEAIEGIFLDASDLTCELSPTVFSEMYRLRLLKIYCSTTSGNQCKLSLPQGLETLPDELRLLHWEYYPLEYLPHKFIPENLVEINMPYSNMDKLWEGKKNLEKLKTIKLSHSRKLTDILMLSEALNLEHIDLEGCTSLIDVSTSITHLRKLVSLNMKDCCHLLSLPSMVDLISLKLVNLSGCSELEDIQDFSPRLKELYLAGTAIRELPSSVENLSELSTLDLENCVRLQKLPSGVRNSRCIVELKLSGCTSLEQRKRKR